ncbi:heme-copper oxidase family protein [Halogranum gelatinilyticum]|nr:hypothetical protein [Halogranum gelatinilyticum]
MSFAPTGVETDYQPPMALPLRHFVVGLVSLVVAGVVGVAVALGVDSALLPLAGLHLLLVGWVGVTIMGAMTQFVPVWSGTQLHSRRLAALQLWLVAGGLAGFVISLTTGTFAALSVFGGLMLAGLWLFAYNLVRTLPPLSECDITELHFAVAVGFVALLSTLGYALAVDLTTPFLAAVGLQRTHVVQAHATVAIFGAVLTTVVGALYQLGPMFTQTEPDGVDHRLRQFEAWGYPAGVLCLAGGRLLAVRPLARLGAALVLVSLLLVAVLLARRLVETSVDPSPMLRRYGVVSVTLAGWAVLTAPSWLRDPLDPGATLGGAAATSLLVVGVVGFVVLGTLYHVVPFIVWEDAYSDRLGFEEVPMIDDLYDHRRASLDFLALTTGLGCLVGTQLGLLPPVARRVGAVLALGGVSLFATNLLTVVRQHGDTTVPGLLTGRGADDERTTSGG